MAGLETPTEHSLVRRYSRSGGVAVRKKEPLLIEQRPAIPMAMRDDQLATHDARCSSSGTRGAFRRAALIALDAEQLRFSKPRLNEPVSPKKISLSAPPSDVPQSPVSNAAQPPTSESKHSNDLQARLGSQLPTSLFRQA